MAGPPPDLAQTAGQPDRQIERLLASHGTRALLGHLAAHWASVLAKETGVGAHPVIEWRLTAPEGFYALMLPGQSAAVVGAAFPGPQHPPSELSYQWYMLGLLRVMSGEHDLAYAYRRRWLAVSGQVRTWRRLQTHGVEARLHRWATDA